VFVAGVDDGDADVASWRFGVGFADAGLVALMARNLGFLGQKNRKNQVSPSFLN